jgi:2-amino-4-hydroxy-6-hydroxymethyldihydropteridine diphosphokinase
MSLILALGSNLGDRFLNLKVALNLINQKFLIIKQSQIYESKPVDYLNQPIFLNMVLECKIPDEFPLEVLNILKTIEKQMGRVKNIEKGPRKIDIDIIFWGTEIINYPELKIPHPEWSKRDFVFYPLQELPYYKTIEKNFAIPDTLNNDLKIYTKE